MVDIVTNIAQCFNSWMAWSIVKYKKDIYILIFHFCMFWTYFRSFFLCNFLVFCLSFVRQNVWSKWAKRSLKVFEDNWTLLDFYEILWVFLKHLHMSNFFIEIRSSYKQLLKITPLISMEIFGLKEVFYKKCFQKLQIVIFFKLYLPTFSIINTVFDCNFCMKFNFICWPVWVLWAKNKTLHV